MINEQIFRAYDIRGVADRDLPDEVVRDIGKAIGVFFGRTEAPTIALGHDPRPSSPRIKEALTRGLLEVGVRILDVDLVPTPVVYFATVEWGCEGGVSITGSHTPREFNGLKLAKGVETLGEAEIQELKSLVMGQSFPEKEAHGFIERRDAASEYLDYIATRIQMPRRLRVVVDAGNAAASEVGPRLLERIGCSVVPLFCQFDGNFPNHFPDPVKAANLRQLQEMVVRENADLGVAFDGDGDRLGVVDDHGNIVLGDFILALFACDLLSRKPGAEVIFNVTTSQAVTDEVTRCGGVPFMFKVGHSNIKSKMRETGALLAGEPSGHFYFGEDYFGYDDAVYSAARLCQLVARQDRPLSQLMQFTKRYVILPEMRVKCADERKFEVTEWMKEQLLQRGDVQKAIDIDGIRAHFTDGWALIRATNTEPALNLRFEATTRERAEAIRKDVLDLLSMQLPSIEEA